MNPQQMTSFPSGEHHASRDDTTRYLCAAAHLDAKFADAAIKEFLVEPTRALPPSPGFRAEFVLAEAAAARVRRKLRDGTLALLMAGVVAMTWSSGLLFGWIALASLLTVPAVLRATQARGWSKARQASAVLILLLVAGAALAADFAFTGTEFSAAYRGSYGSSGYSYGYGDYPSSSGDVVADLAAIPALLMLAVLVADRLAVWQRLTERFGYGTRHLPPRDPFIDTPLLNGSPASFRAQLERYRALGAYAAESAPLVVYRGYDPFVGAGLHREPWSMVLPLEKLGNETEPDSAPREELTTSLLYQRVREAMSRLQTSSGLSPDERLRSLRIVDTVYVPADRLIDNLDNPATTAYLPNPSFPPQSHLSPEEVAALRDEPREWARYYLRFEVETWNRGLVISSFLHVAVDTSTLYLEWTPCVLPPIRESYRRIDKLVPSIARPVGEAVLRWLKLPVTIIGRTVHTLTFIRPLPRRPGFINSDAYGNLQTLREMAAATDVESYFQLVDIERYEKIMHSRLIPAISQVLRDCGYSPVRFEKQAEQVTNNTFIGDINGPVNTGVVHGDQTGTTSVTG